MNRRQVLDTGHKMIRNRKLRKDLDEEYLDMSDRIAPHVRGGLYLDDKVIIYIPPANTKMLKAGALIRNMKNRPTDTEVDCRKIVRASKVLCRRKGYVRISDVDYSRCRGEFDEVLGGGDVLT